MRIAFVTDRFNARSNQKESPARDALAEQLFVGRVVPKQKRVDALEEVDRVADLLESVSLGFVDHIIMRLAGLEQGFMQLGRLGDRDLLVLLAVRQKNRDGDALR